MDMIKNPNGRFILQISSLGYNPYKNLVNHIFTNTQQAPPATQSFLVSPVKVASISIQLTMVVLLDKLNK